MVFVICRKFQL